MFVCSGDVYVTIHCLCTTHTKHAVLRGSALPVESQDIISAEKNCWKSRQNVTETVVAHVSGIGWRTLQLVRQAIVSHDRAVYLTQATKTAAAVLPVL